MKLLSKYSCTISINHYNSYQSSNEHQRVKGLEMIKQHTRESLLYKVVDRELNGCIITRTITILFFTITLKARQQ